MAGKLRAKNAEVGSQKVQVARSIAINPFPSHVWLHNSFSSSNSSFWLFVSSLRVFFVLSFTHGSFSHPYSPPYVREYRAIPGTIATEMGPG